MNQDNLPSGFSTMSSSIEFADNYNKWIINKFRPYMGNRLLEVGTGQGNFKKYLQFIDNYVSIDIDEAVIERAKKRNPTENYYQVDITKIADIQKIQDFKFDTVMMVNVLEHIENDYAALKNLYDLISPGGHILIFVPAFMNLYNDFDRLAGHFLRYTKKTFKQRSKELEKNIVKLEYFNPVGAAGWWANKFKKHNDLDSPETNKQIRFFDKYLIPVSKITNPVFKSFFGQSLIVVIRKN